MLTQLDNNHAQLSAFSQQSNV